MFKRLIVAAVLSAPSLVLAGQGMSVEDGFALANNSGPSEIDAVIAPMQDGGADSMHEPGTGRGSGDVEHAATDNSGARAPHSARGTAPADAGNTHAHKAHGGKAAWQSLLPGVMK